MRSIDRLHARRSARQGHLRRRRGRRRKGSMNAGASPCCPAGATRSRATTKSSLLRCLRSGEMVECGKIAWLPRLSMHFRSAAASGACSNRMRCARANRGTTGRIRPCDSVQRIITRPAPRRWIWQAIRGDPVDDAVERSATTHFHDGRKPNTLSRETTIVGMATESTGGTARIDHGSRKPLSPDVHSRPIAQSIPGRIASPRSDPREAAPRAPAP